MRLDHILLSPEMSERLVDGGVDRWVRGEENASDHAPAWIVLEDAMLCFPPLPAWKPSPLGHSTPAFQARTSRKKSHSEPEACIERSAMSSRTGTHRGPAGRLSVNVGLYDKFACPILIADFAAP